MHAPVSTAEQEPQIWGVDSGIVSIRTEEGIATEPYSVIPLDANRFELSFVVENDYFRTTIVRTTQGFDAHYALRPQAPDAAHLQALDGFVQHFTRADGLVPAPSPAPCSAG